jgi:hypothetical protein
VADLSSAPATKRVDRRRQGIDVDPGQTEREPRPAWAKHPGSHRHPRRYHHGMAAPSTTSVEIDSELLRRLRERRPEKSDREVLESVARIQLGREASARVKQRFAGVPSEEVEREAAKAVREVREEMAAERRAGS